jgi:hypothetical protein
MAEQGFDLGDIFNMALQGMTSKRQEVNDLDGYNGNHGDNMVANLDLITKALRAQPDRTPSDALSGAAEQVREEGSGGTSKYYAKGLAQAAQRLEGHNNVSRNDVMDLLQTLMGAIPSQGYPEKPEAAESVLSQVLGPRRAVPSSPKADTEPEAAVDLGNVVETLLPMGLAFLQAKQAGAETTEAATQVLMQTVLGQPNAGARTGSPRTAAGGVIVQSILSNLVNR